MIELPMQTCRACHQTLKHLFVDLGEMPPSNAYLSSLSEVANEKSYPLKVYVCHHCWLVQTQDFVNADAMFNDDYAYFSSISKGWLEHAKSYSEMIIKRLCLTRQSKVVEIASNDGYLLRNFVAANIPCLGIEPTIATSQMARTFNVPVINEFFTESFAKELVDKQGAADLIIGNNVLAHVPNIHDFIAGMKIALANQGTITLEFPHLLELVEKNQFDTIYHEHFSYLSLFVVNQLFNDHELKVYHVEPLSTHGGSLRVYACHQSANIAIEASVTNMLEKELASGMQSLDYYLEFQPKVVEIKQTLIHFLNEQKAQGKTVVGYGAAAKGNTLLNYAGITTDLLAVIFDAAPSKQNMFMPASHIPIKPPEELVNYDPDYVLILPWNIQEELINQLSRKQLSSSYVVAIPQLNIMGG